MGLGVSYYFRKKMAGVFAYFFGFFCILRLFYKEFCSEDLWVSEVFIDLGFLRSNFGYSWGVLG